MRIPWKTLNSGFSLPAYGFGLSEVGGGSWQADHSRDGEHIFALNRAMDAGIRHFDTAQGYGAGHAEELLGAALAGRDRAEFVIATKVSAVNQTYDGIMRAAQNSLKKLGVDHIDLYLMHTYPKPGMDIAEAMRGFNALIEQGMVRHIGGANLTPCRFAEAQRHSAARLVCNQVHYNVRYREPEVRGVVEHARSNDVMLVAWRPLQAGHLPVPAMIRDIAQRYGRTPTQVALNWLISQRNVVVICKSATPEHLAENLGALGWAMDVEDVEWIRRDFPNQITASDTVPMDYPAASAA
jgi:diketogulonate reductase-like aldo/keto reductase